MANAKGVEPLSSEYEIRRSDPLSYTSNRPALRSRHTRAAGPQRTGRVSKTLTAGIRSAWDGRRELA